MPLIHFSFSLIDFQRAKVLLGIDLMTVVSVGERKMVTGALFNLGMDLSLYLFNIHHQTSHVG